MTVIPLRPRENGACNTHSEDTQCPPRVFCRQNSDTAPEARVGVDTVSWGWRDPEAVDRLMRLDGLVVSRDDPRPLRVVPAPGGAVRVSRRLNGLGTLGAFPGVSLLFVEGRARALAARDETDHRLGAVRSLRGLEDQVTEDLGSLLGAGVRAPAALRRVDLAGELAYTRGEDGRQLLAILDSLHSPNYKTAPVRERGGPGIETAYWRTPKRSVPVLRAYDKGLESGTAAAGERVRIERQLRYGASKRPTVDQWLARDLASLYVSPLRAWLKDGVTAGTADEIMRALTDARVIWPNYWCSGSSWASSTGSVRVPLWHPSAKVERILGAVAIVSSWGGAWPGWDAKTRQRRLAEIRKHGLLLTDRPVSVDVDHAVNSLCELWSKAA